MDEWMNAFRVIAMARKCVPTKINACLHCSHIGGSGNPAHIDCRMWWMDAIHSLAFRALLFAHTLQPFLFIVVCQIWKLLTEGTTVDDPKVMESGRRWERIWMEWVEWHVPVFEKECKQWQAVQPVQVGKLDLCQQNGWSEWMDKEQTHEGNNNKCDKINLLIAKKTMKIRSRGQMFGFVKNSSFSKKNF